MALVGGASMPLVPPQGQEVKIQEYEKIIKFRDDVIAGKHPRIKVPAHLVPKSPKSRSLSTSTPQQSAQQQQPTAINGNRMTENHRAFAQNTYSNLAGLETRNGSIGNGFQRGERPSGPHPEINPIFLEKSDELLHAEFRIKRKRVEQECKDQNEQQRRVKLEIQRATDQAPEFDIVDTLHKALTLVQGVLPQPTDKAAASKSAADDSFDENTFYSSNFSTPNSAHIARVPVHQSEDEDVQMDESSDYEPDAESDSPPKPTPAAPRTNIINNQSAQASVPPALSAPFRQETQTRPPAHADNRPGEMVSDIAQYSQTRPPHHRVSQVIGPHSYESGEASASNDTDYEEGFDEFGRRRRRQPVEGRASRGEPAVIRTHHLSPIAPQPAHISSLANSQHAAISIDDLPTTRGTPAQVAALRRNKAAITSPESSPQGARQEKRNKKGKNKRKAERQAERAPSPYIKPEPKSPSPMSAPAFVRPNKRQKQGPGSAQQVEYDPARYEAVPAAAPTDGRTRVYRDDTGALVYERPDTQYAGQAARPIIVEDSGRRGHDPYEGRYLERSHMERPPSRGSYRVASAAPIIQRPMSRAYVEVPAQTGYVPTPRIESRPIYEPSRMSMRPPGERDRSRSPVMRARSPVMAPPSRANPPRRIVVDEYGREYIEPLRPTPSMIQQSVPPPNRPGESEVIYERGPAPMPRAVSRMPDTFEQDGVIYRRASPTYPPARRVVTQPEYAIPEQPTYRQREYSARPAQPVSEYAPVRQTTTRIEEPPRDYDYGYASRAPSTRPAEPIRYEAAPAYDNYPVQQVMQSSQPVMTRAYSVRPPESAPIVQRAYSVRPVEHQPQQPVYGGRQIIRGDEEVAYIERPRGQEVRREYY